MLVPTLDELVGLSAAWMLTFVAAGVLTGLTVGLVTDVAVLRMRPMRGHGTRATPAPDL
ncbi:MAG: hypothetical protein R3176_09080 [Woeseiaceae bacterium]|nr:hypothetical protein [Woeseiaceae bacterium]